MEYTKRQVQLRASKIRGMYWEGKLSVKEAAQYESLPGWKWEPCASMSFTKARVLARAQHFTNSGEFYKWERPSGIPSTPNVTYADSGWLGYKDFLGNAFMSFTKARARARAQRLAGSVEFVKWTKPKGIPKRPDKAYADSGWVSWGDFLGTNNVSGSRPKNFMSFTKARALARAQHFTNAREFFNWQSPSGLPSTPNVTYADSGWIGYGDFLGNKKRKTK